MPRFVHHATTNADETTISIAGLPRPLTLVHITDCHMAEVDERDAPIAEDAARRRATFAALSPVGADLPGNLHRSFAASTALDADCVVLTGDIVDFPSAANLERLGNELAALHCPYLYTCGNHDWQYPHFPATEANRAEYHPRFHQFTGGNPSFQVRDLDGVRLIVLDNSTYQIDATQVAFLREQLAGDLPCLLFMHIPIYIPSLEPDVVAKWGAPIMMAAPTWEAEKQRAWSVRDEDESTTACHALLTGEDAASLGAIFCGHVHFAHADAFGPERTQYVTRPGFEGAHRVIRLVPA